MFLNFLFAYVLTIVNNDFRSSLFLSLFLLCSLLFTHFRDTQEAEILFGLIFWHNKKKYKKSFFFIFIFFTKKNIFTASVWSRNPGPTLDPGVLNLTNIYLGNELRLIPRSSVISPFPLFLHWNNIPILFSILAAVQKNL